VNWDTVLVGAACVTVLSFALAAAMFIERKP
jgi:hypothetical protein